MAALKRRAAPAPVISDEDEVARFFEARETAASELARLIGQRPETVANGTEEDVIALDDAIVRTRVRVEQAEVAHARAVHRRMDRIQAEDQERAAALYRQGEIAAAEAQRLYTEAYPPAAQAVADILTRIVEQEAIVAAANRNLPVGKERIADPEPWNGSPPFPGRVAGAHVRLLDHIRLPRNGVGAGYYRPRSPE